ncbi:MAG: ATP-binding cassette domain-containing protein [Verrucomicrobiia bacterium]
MVSILTRAKEKFIDCGPSGCGKTTLLSLIAGTLDIDEGEVDVFETPLHRLSKRRSHFFVEKM